MNDRATRQTLLAFAAAALCASAIAAAAGQAAPSASGPAQPQPKIAAVAEDPGEKVFNANCSRCHTPPMTLKPRITGTIVMHMRVRARLSRKDEQALLKYLAP